MVLQVLADALQFVHQGNAGRLQHRALADPRKLQDLRRGHGSRRQDHLALASGGLGLAVLQILDACGALALEQDL